MIRGDATVVIDGVTPREVFDFVLDPAQYTKADTKVVWVTKIADIPGGMIAREDGRFLGKVPGSIVTRYTWEPPHRIDVVLEHGFPRSLHAWFEIEQVDGGTRVRHVEEIEMGRGLVGALHDRAVRAWWAQSVRDEVHEIKRLMEAGHRGAPFDTGEKERAKPAPKKKPAAKKKAASKKPAAAKKDGGASAPAEKSAEKTTKKKAAPRKRAPRKGSAQASDDFQASIGSSGGTTSTGSTAAASPRPSTTK